MDWIRHPGIAVVDDHQSDIIRGNAQERIYQIVRPHCYVRPVFQSCTSLAQTYKIPSPPIDLMLLVELLPWVIIITDYMPWEIAAYVAVIAILPSLKPDLGVVVDLWYSRMVKKQKTVDLLEVEWPILVIGDRVAVAFDVLVNRRHPNRRHPKLEEDSRASR